MTCARFLTMSIAPTDYEEWKHCITVKCKISLTDEYVQHRIKALCNHKDKHTKQFIDLYGTDHHALTLSWFKKVANELKEK